ncbi:hypothetical protein KIN20_032834 [Parelaphostrongylus tenuis]|uniref:Uncharacterized protein n=1 Tax=Parelaphostrongylus tenuis TaxID=148309 RepID=A0AAD5R9E8_PARTN|nr:hypothetical protein KIN20_032834 [Parelaphostrongylus tenuis]
MEVPTVAAVYYAFKEKKVRSIGNVVSTHIAKTVETQEKDVMHDFVEKHGTFRCLRAFKYLSRCIEYSYFTDAMSTFVWCIANMNPSDALIESIGQGCLSIEEQESCYIEPQETEFGTNGSYGTLTVPIADD